MSFAHSFRVETATQLVNIMADQGVYLPMDIGLGQMTNIRFVFLIHRLRQLPFDIIKIDDCWFIDKIVHSSLNPYFKQGDRLLIINRTMVSDDLHEDDIFRLLLYSSMPFAIWVTWDADTFLKYQQKFNTSVTDDAYVSAKAYLLKTNSYDEISLYDQLALIVSHAIENPQENINKLIKNFYENNQYPILKSNLRSVKEKERLDMMKIHARLLQKRKEDDNLLKSMPSLMEISNYCSNAGYGIHSNEMFLVWSAMKQLNNRIDCFEMKFWGKIFGLYCDYYIVQIQHENKIPDDEIIDILDLFSDQKKEIKHSDQQEPFLNEIPSEPHGTGTNQYTYFVTNSPGLPWVKLPDLKPSVLIQARKIRYLFTGCLSSEMNQFSPNYGLEKDYLRAQIARITATTHISPAGFYILNENINDEEEISIQIEENKLDVGIKRNPEFNNDSTNPITAESLSNTDLQEWVHSEREILPQGRTKFWRSPSPTNTNLSTEADEDEDDDHHHFQMPAPLLQPIGDDKLLHTKQNSWSIGLTMSIMREYSVCYVRSNLWPGAFTLGDAKNFYNFYIGWGQKYEQYEPNLPSPPEREYSSNFLEAIDPSVELEQAAHQTVTSDEETFEDLSFEDDETH